MFNFLTFLFILMLIIILSLFSFFFSASETAVIGLSKIRLRHLLQKGIRHAQKIHNLVTQLDKFIAAILIGNDLVNIAIASIITAIFVQLFNYQWGVIIATFVSSFFILVFCEITPKILATKYTEKIALITAPVMDFFIKIFYPFIFIFTGISNSILKIFKITPTKRSPLITEEELKLMIEIGKDEGVLSETEKKMLHRIFEFGDLKVKDVMVPKEKIVGVNINASNEELLNVFAEEGYSRLPVYKESLDEILGIVYSRDLLYLLKDNRLFLLSDIIHPAYFVPEEMRVSELLLNFQKQKIQIAIIVDKDKKTKGLVTLEDLLEEIVGEIEEEPRICSLEKNNKIKT